MKTYNIAAKETKVGEFKISAISLGESGRGRKLTIVPCPERFQFLEPGLSQTNRPRLNNSNVSEGWLARISTKGDYIRGALGCVYANPHHLHNEINQDSSNVPEPKIKVIARGNGAFGDAGRIGSWDDLIITLPDESWVRVKPTRNEAYILYFGKKEVSKLSYEEAKALDLDLELYDSGKRNKGNLIQL